MNRNTCLYKIAGTETFRLSSSEVFGKGTNLQNVPKNLRTIYVPDDPSKVFIQVDQSGAEALIVSYLTRAGKFRDLFLHKVKPHVFVALNVFKDKWLEKAPQLAATIELATKTEIKDLKTLPNWKTLDELIKSSDNWPAKERYYYIAKMICHASNYGMKGPTFQLNVLEKSEGAIVLSRQQADSYLSAYHSLFPEIMEWHCVVQEQLYKTRRLYNLQGFPREFTGWINDSMLKEAYAFIPQSTVGTITNIAYTNLQNYIEDNNKQWDLLSNCHDSYLCQAPKEEVEECKTKMLFFMQQELTSHRGEKFSMKAEAQVGRNWGVYHEIKNPEGLKET